MPVIAIAGASGFMGSDLRHRFLADGWEVRTIGRSGADAVWADPASVRRAVDGADAVLNLAGKSVNCRYTPENRAELVRSRIETTRAIGIALRTADSPPPVWLNASTATIYRHAGDRPMTEDRGEIGFGFSVSVATAWEHEFFAGDTPGTRRVALRTAIVLGDGSALAPLTGLVRAGLGGPQLDGRWWSTRARREAGTFHDFRPGTAWGRQRFSWIHVEDVHGIVRFLIDRDDIEGPVNLASPEVVDNRTMMRTLRRVLHVPVGLPAFRWMLELGTAVLRTETELVLKSRWAVPARLNAAGYRFRRPSLDDALRDLLG